MALAVNKTVKFGVILALLAGFLAGGGLLGLFQDDAQGWGLAGFAVQVPVRYHVSYLSRDMGDGYVVAQDENGDPVMSDPYREDIVIDPLIDTSEIRAEPIYLSEFASRAKAWIGQRVPRLNNQVATVNDAEVLPSDAEPDPDKDWASYTDCPGSETGEGYTLYVGGKWSFDFKDGDGSTLYMRTIRNAVLLRIEPQTAGKDDYMTGSTVTVYIPKWKLPEDETSIGCKLDYELQKYSIRHDWHFGKVWQSVSGSMNTLVRGAIERAQGRVSGVWDRVGSWVATATVVALAVVAIAVFPVFPPGGIAFGAAACALGATLLLKNADGQEEELPAVSDSGYDTPIFKCGSGTVTFTVQIVGETAEGTDVRDEKEVNIG